jgi:superfamily II DNA or RNA helicase
LAALDMRLVFDRGTLLLLEPAAEDLRFLPGVLWDPRVALWRAPAHRYADVVDGLRGRGLAFRDETLRPSDATFGSWNDVELRPYQRAALLSWELQGKNGILVLPTGSGKTRLAIAAIRESARRTLCLVPTRALLQQWVAELARVYHGKVGVLGDGEHDLRPITVATFESAYRHMADYGDYFELLVVDEVHHFGGGIRDEALELAIAPFRLGLTATPPAEHALRALELLVGAIVFQLGVSDLTGTYLASFDLVVMRLPLDRDERHAYDRDRRAFADVYRPFRQLHRDASWEEFRAMAASSPEGRAALAAWHRSRRLISFTRAKSRALEELLLRHADEKVIVFTADNDSAYTVSREQLLMPITCDIGRKERTHALSAFRAGELRSLVSSRVLNEGIDVPDAQVAIILGGAHGEREHVQRIGRLLRPAPGKRAVVYELVSAGTSEMRQSLERRKNLVTSSPRSRGLRPLRL